MASETIWKFPLEVTESQLVRLPVGAKVLSVQTQLESPCLWALVNPEVEKESRIFYTFGTGHEVRILGGRLEFVDTYQLAEGALVFHVFEGVHAYA
jgi:hypothetical protein